MDIKNTSRIVLAVFLSLAIFFLLGEVGIRVYLKYKTVYDIEMTKYAINIKKEADNPLIGHVHRPNVSAWLMDSMVQINSDGLRDREYEIAKNNKYRIITLGDSLTFGWGVEEKDSFSNLLEVELNEVFPVEVINFGAGNYNTVQEVNLFIEEGLKYKPDKVVLFYFINDAETTPEKSSLWFLGYSQLVSFYWSRINAFINNYFPSQSFASYYSNLYDDKQKGWIDSRNAFLQIKDICQKEKIQLQVVLLPELHDLKNEIFKNIYDTISSFLQKNNISYLNLAPLFKDYENPLDLWVSYDDAHPNEIAHKVIAESTLDFISLKEHRQL